MTHVLKTWPRFFEPMLAGLKTFEFRQDRSFKEGDTLKLLEFEPTSEAYTGRVLWVEVRLIVRECPGLPQGYVLMQVEKSEPEPPDETVPF